MSTNPDQTLTKPCVSRADSACIFCALFAVLLPSCSPVEKFSDHEPTPPPALTMTLEDGSLLYGQAAEVQISDTQNPAGAYLTLGVAADPTRTTSESVSAPAGTALSINAFIPLDVLESPSWGFVSSLGPDGPWPPATRVYATGIRFAESDMGFRNQVDGVEVVIERDGTHLVGTVRARDGAFQSSFKGSIAASCIVPASEFRAPSPSGGSSGTHEVADGGPPETTDDTAFASQFCQRFKDFRP